MTRRQKAFEKRLQALIDGAGRLEDDAARRVVRLLEVARSEIAAEVATTEWQALRLAELKSAVERTLSGFRQGALADQSAGISNAWNAGIDMIDAPLASAGIRAGAPEISRALLEVMQGYSLDLIEGLSAEALKNVNNALTMGLLGQQTPYQVMQQVGLSVDGPGVMGQVSRRAETIVRTEMGRVQSLARAARMQAVTEAGTDPPMKWKKRWIDSGKAHPREDHAALDGVTVELNEDFPGGIPYPHAPGLPAGQVINCGCTHVLVSDDWDDLPRAFTPIDYAERADYGRAD
jgi:hypothetical protein